MAAPVSSFCQAIREESPTSADLIKNWSSGVIINMGSIAGLTVDTTFASASYSAAKAGMIHLSKWAGVIPNLNDLTGFIPAADSNCVVAHRANMLDIIPLRS